jgi:cephalosporin hydroxylase
MKDFEALKQTFFHRVACGPYEHPTSTLVLSDIVLHLPILEYYASQCEHVTELGVRGGQSTVALVSGCTGEVHSYDIEKTDFVDFFQTLYKPCSWFFHQGDTANPSLGIQDTDLLFIDTLHTYNHVKQELNLWGRKARKYLIFHDTFTCGYLDISGPDPTQPGILKAIEEFLASYPGEYETVYQTKCCNGLWVLKRCS